MRSSLRSADIFLVVASLPPEGENRLLEIRVRFARLPSIPLSNDCFLGCLLSIVLYHHFILRGQIRLDRVSPFTREGGTRTDLIQSDPDFVANPYLVTFKPLHLYCSFLQ